MAYDSSDEERWEESWRLKLREELFWQHNCLTDADKWLSESSSDTSTTTSRGCLSTATTSDLTGTFRTPATSYGTKRLRNGNPSIGNLQFSPFYAGLRMYDQKTFSTEQQEYSDEEINS